MEKYSVEFLINGNVIVGIDAENEEEAESKADDKVVTSNIGEIIMEAFRRSGMEIDLNINFTRLC